MISAHKKNIYIMLAFISFVFFAHLLFVVNTTSYWDSCAYIYNIVHGKYDTFILPWDQNGRSLMGAIYWLIGHNIATLLHINSSLMFRLFSLFGIILSGLLVYALLRKFMRLDKITCFFIIMLGAIYPAYQVHLSFTTIIFVLCLPFYLISLYLALLQDQTSPLLKKFSIRIISIICLLISFISEATIPMTFIIVIILFAYEYKSHHLSRFLNILKFLASHIDYIAIPFLYLFFMMKYMAPYGPYATSRTLDLSSLALSKIAIDYLSVGFNIGTLIPFANYSFYTFNLFHINWLNINLSLLALGVILLLYLFNKHKQLTTQKPIKNILLKKYFLLFCLGIIAFLISVSTFIAANRSPTFDGWGIRFLTIAAFPFSITVISYIKILLLLINKNKAKIFIAIMSIIIALTTITLYKNYLTWISRNAIDESITINLQRDKSISRPPPAIVIKQYFMPVFGEAYRYYEWTYIVNKAWPTTPTIAFYDNPTGAVSLQDIKKYIKFFCDQGEHDLVRDVNLKIPPMIISIETSRNINWLLGGKYLANKLLLSGKNFNDWLQSLVTIHVENEHVR